jgi:hypothetical protein
MPQDSGGFGGYIPPSKHVSFDHGPGMADFMDSVQRTLILSPDYGGMGGHELRDEPPHGLHSQVDIRIGSRTIDFRWFP